MTPRSQSDRILFIFYTSRILIFQPMIHCVSLSSTESVSFRWFYLAQLKRYTTRATQGLQDLVFWTRLSMKSTPSSTRGLTAFSRSTRALFGTRNYRPAHIAGVCAFISQKVRFPVRISASSISPCARPSEVAQRCKKSFFTKATRFRLGFPRK